MIDVMIITHNEALNLPHCLKALDDWTHKIFVIDSGSTDGTEDVAGEHGAEFVHHDWPGYAKQKNWGLDNLPFESDWILILDADEIVTPELHERLVEIVSKPVDSVKENGFFINRLTYFLGKPIRHGGYFPSWNMRFFKRGMAYYEHREVHEHMIIDGAVGYVKEPMIHDDRRGLEHYVAKHNRYSTLEARALFDELINKQAPVWPSANVTLETRWRRWLKRNVLPRAPMPWLWRFLYMYIIRLGILDGGAGLEFCKFISVYDYMVAMKYRALRRQKGLAATQAEATHVSALAIPEGADREKAIALPAPTRVDGEAQRTAAPARAPRAAPGRRIRRRPRRARSKLPSEGFTVAGPWAPVSVVVLTMNEETNIRECLDSCAWCDDLHILDSGSTDATVERAEGYGAQVHHHRFISFGDQRNWAIRNIPFKYDWVFHLDADERFTPELVEAIKGTVESDPAESGFYVPNKLMLMGRWLKRSGGYPTYQMRLFHQRRMRFCDYGHGQRELTDGGVGTIDEPYLHYGFSKGLTEWFGKHNGYSTLEAIQALDESNKPRSLRELMARDPVKRRRAWKELGYHLPFRPTLRGIMTLFVFGGILEGRAARTYVRMLSIYEQMITLKLQLLREKPDAAAMEIAADHRIQSDPETAAGGTSEGAADEERSLPAGTGETGRQEAMPPGSGA